MHSSLVSLLIYICSSNVGLITHYLLSSSGATQPMALGAKSPHPSPFLSFHPAKALVF